MGNIHVKIYMKLGPVVQEMSFKNISYLELWQPLRSVDWNDLCKIFAILVECIMRNNHVKLL